MASRSGGLVAPVCGSLCVWGGESVCLFVCVIVADSFARQRELRLLFKSPPAAFYKASFKHVCMYRTRHPDPEQQVPPRPHTFPLKPPAGRHYRQEAAVSLFSRVVDLENYRQVRSSKKSSNSGTLLCRMRAQRSYVCCDGFEASFCLGTVEQSILG